MLDLINVLGNLEMTVENITEELFVVQTVTRVVWLRFSTELPNLIITVRDKMRANNFSSNEERCFYLEYNLSTKFILKSLIITGVTCTISNHLKPLALRTVASKFISAYRMLLLLDCYKRLLCYFFI